MVMTYNAIHYAKGEGIYSRKGMGGFYRSLKDIDLPSYYKSAIIARACTTLKTREKTRRRRIQVRHPKPLKPAVTILGGFFTTVTGKLFVSLGHGEYEMIQLSSYAYGKVSEAGVKLRSLTITPNVVSLFYSKDVKPLSTKTVFGLDRNVKNITFGNVDLVVQVSTSDIPKIYQTTREIVGSFRRDDARIRKKIARKYGKRARHRTNEILHNATNYVVEMSALHGAALALEDLACINKMYRKGNGQGAEFRFRMNAWPHRKACVMIDYKAAWKGVTIIRLTKAETYGTSSNMCAGRTSCAPMRVTCVTQEALGVPGAGLGWIGTSTRQWCCP